MEQSMKGGGGRAIPDSLKEFKKFSDNCQVKFCLDFFKILEPAAKFHKPAHFFYCQLIFRSLKMKHHNHKNPSHHHQLIERGG